MPLFLLCSAGPTRFIQVCSSRVSRLSSEVGIGSAAGSCTQPSLAWQAQECADGLESEDDVPGYGSISDAKLPRTKASPLLRMSSLRSPAAQGMGTPCIDWLGRNAWNFSFLTVSILLSA